MRKMKFFQSIFLAWGLSFVFGVLCTKYSSLSTNPVLHKVCYPSIFWPLCTAHLYHRHSQGSQWFCRPSAASSHHTVTSLCTSRKLCTLSAQCTPRLWCMSAHYTASTSYSWSHQFYKDHCSFSPNWPILPLPPAASLSFPRPQTWQPHWPRVRPRVPAPGWHGAPRQGRLPRPARWSRDSATRGSSWLSLGWGLRDHVRADGDSWECSSWRPNS